ncbi:hypothetical protein VST7929_01550 [Vibrio stylophorae]|uniref:Suppressor of fused-like domain-containing protein n=1 Tax=Vibrio stylophorae TaxID=659351 RepID=A0ABN8DRA0_9VIBR|nr:suppressor of fused domain protein [Vibrio stylophorae]CAH0533679.1 hypothetical protein VST7929_01550 [Vibrio stylophorae]
MNVNFVQEHRQRMQQHISEHIAPVDQIYHDLSADLQPIDIYHIKPTQTRPFHTLITAGMSDHPMNLPLGVQAPQHLELMVTLPQEWEVNENAFRQSQWYWPIAQLKFIARFPKQYKTWLGWGHTLPNGDPSEPFADNTKMSGMMIVPSLHVPQSFYQLPLESDKTVHYFALVPLYDEEMTLKLEQGIDPLLDGFHLYGATDLIDITRPNIGASI